MENQVMSLVEVHTKQSNLSVSDAVRLYLDDSLSEEELVNCCAGSKSSYELVYGIIAQNWYSDNQASFQSIITVDSLLVRLLTTKPLLQADFDESLQEALELEK
jgi:hypothetical protein